MKNLPLFAFLSLLSPMKTWATQIEYEMTDICRATINVMHKRDISGMTATSLNDGTARVQYVRPEDGKVFSFRCHSSEKHSLSILNETLPDQHWIGEQADDVQYSYWINKDKLVIHSYHQDHINDVSFSQNDFPVSSVYIQDNEKLRNFAKILARDYPGGKLKLSKVHPVVKKTMISYRLDFETSSKSLQLQPGGEYGNKTYFENEGRLKAWEERFCSADLKKIMHDNHIDFVSGVTLSNGKEQLMTACF